MKCKNLKDSRFSTGALWWSYKDRTGPPTLPDHRYLKTFFLFDAKEVLYSCFSKRSSDCIIEFLGVDRCSVCNKVILRPNVFHAWFHADVATDRQSLLARMCCRRCPDLNLFKLLKNTGHYGVTLGQPKRSRQKYKSLNPHYTSRQFMERDLGYSVEEAEYYCTASE